MKSKDIILRIVMSEKASRIMEEENALTFIVLRQANKHEIKNAIEKLYGIKVESIRTMITPKGEKKAIAKLSKEYKAIDVATKFGLM
ncbi:MAG: 50S ribosomal protein L23 [Caldisphaeraceae archaeon]|nr:50S ribosomal protein L23 [Caldisphaeraceae archaeon]